MSFPEKKTTINNLEAIKVVLEECINAGMLDPDARFYNELNDLIDEAHLSKTPPDLQEVITQAKILETDIDAWLSRKGRTTISLMWPIIE